MYYIGVYIEMAAGTALYTGSCARVHIDIDVRPNTLWSVRKLSKNNSIRITVTADAIISEHTSRLTPGSPGGSEIFKLLYMRGRVRAALGSQSSLCKNMTSPNTPVTVVHSVTDLTV